jgi:hypothetical protein
MTITARDHKKLNGNALLDTVTGADAAIIGKIIADNLLIVAMQ